jgi:drug/metabolite transporter (DMT)-like permease
MAKGRTVSTYGVLAVGVISIAWSAIFVRWTHMPGVASAFYRMFFAAVVLCCVLAFSRVTLAGIDRSTIGVAVLSGVFFAGDVGLFNTAVLHTSAGSATFLANNAPVLVGLLTWAITRRLPSRRFWTALAIALVGAWLIVAADARHAGREWSADLLAVMASVCFALYLLTTERLRKNIDTRILVTLSATSSAVVLLLISALAHISLAVPNAQSLAALLGLGLICQLTGYFCLTYALGHLPATVTSVVLLAVAPITALLAFGLFGEHMTILQGAGGVFVILGVWIVSRAHQGSSRDSRDSSAFDAVG